MILFYLLIGALPLNDQQIWSQFLGDFTVIKLLGGVCAVWALLRAISRPQPLASSLRTGTAISCLLLFLVMSVSHFLHEGKFTFAPGPLVVIISFMLLLLTTTEMVDSMKRLRWVLLVAVGAMAFSSLYVIKQWIAFHDVYEGFRSWGGVSGDPNYFVLSATLWMPMCFIFMRGREVWWERWYYLGCFITIAMAIAVAASRGGFLGLLASFIFLLWHTRERLRNFALVTLLLTPFVLLPSSPIKRLTNPTKSDQEAADSRVVLWHVGIRMFEDKPIFGVGLSLFPSLVPQYAYANEDAPQLVAHNTYVHLGAELGVVGLLPFLAVLVFAYRSLGKVMRQTEVSGPVFFHQTALAMRAGLVAFGVGAFFLTAWWQRMFWFFLFLTICLVTIQRRQAALASASSEGQGG
jgi:hypothetical protein